ncbi:uncharacterized protein PGTG_08204 [Puccinia graminis f. sp. tritici CRL 75-36-700-3]|uniref:Uncharacterized protein n=1 Tax=Puccinia graminis f. sp. tritici (strain CRL 75-36-700-3 / race SCCL) TaxID=418459 RepID=E3KBU3_PUCGT|nr:uncharacterized protein PGTG_08204 [Puccinia graminis f. sp. tritici CRL 75-36-700-3]EFP81955.2 hypothetical protein PGTG_08204 [Puccinia graminis f. sp. tritici CRL 75-36-700-3]
MGLGAHGLPTPRWVSVSHCHAPQSQTFKKADQGNPHAAMPASNISDSALQTPTSLAKNNTQAKKKKLFDGQTRDLPQARPDPNCLKSGAGLGILFGIVARPGPPHAPRRGGFGFWPRARPIDSLILNELFAEDVFTLAKLIWFVPARQEGYLSGELAHPLSARREPPLIRQREYQYRLSQQVQTQTALPGGKYLPSTATKGSLKTS